jgi:nucleoside-diphosphate-sugar epimerase
VDDIARGTIQALKPVGYEIINLGGHQSISINDLISIMEEYIGKKAVIEHQPFHKADMRANHADVSKAGSLLNWEPAVSLEQGVHMMIDWHKENQNWLKNIETE